MVVLFVGTRRWNVADEGGNGYSRRSTAEHRGCWAIEVAAVRNRQ